jgi:DNA replication and repair protein RecF
LEFSDKLNLIVGGNGQGKTSILEAIYYLCTTKNLNHAAENDVVSFGEQFFEVRGDFNQLTENKNRLFYDAAKNKKILFVDEKLENKSSEIIGRFPVVSLIQSDHAITFGSPSERRRFVDSVISQISKTYLEILIEYGKILRQRSSLLSQIKETRNPELYNQLEVWTEQLIKNGTEIIHHRKRFIKEFNVYVKEAFRKIVQTTEEPIIKYESFETEEEGNIYHKLKEEIESVKEEEVRRSINLVGPHRDDFIFLINGKELKRFGSQGQHKTFQIALRFAQFFYMKEALGKTPIFLMDDVFGELDSSRAVKINNYLEEIGQAFITMTDFSRKELLHQNKNNLLIEVENGKVVFS